MLADGVMPTWLAAIWLGYGAMFAYPASWLWINYGRHE
jgi:hypothetical protein